MMKRCMTLVLTLLLVFAVVIPAAAQDAPSTPQPCSKDDLANVLTTISTIAPKLATAAKTTTTVQTTEQFTGGALAWGDVYQTFFTDTYNAFPACIDGVLMSDYMGLLFNEQMSLLSTGLYNQVLLEAKANDADVTQALGDLSKIQAKTASNLGSGFSGYTASLKAGTGQPTWLPACTDDQMKLATQLDDFEKTYYDQSDALQSYLDNGTVDKDTYITIAKGLSEMSSALDSGSASCAELYQRALNCMYLYGDTFTALSLGQTAPYLKDSADAEAFNSLVTYYNGVLTSYLTPATATPSS